MAKFLVLENAQAGGGTLKAGAVVDSGNMDIPSLEAAGVKLRALLDDTEDVATLIDLLRRRQAKSGPNATSLSLKDKMPEPRVGLTQPKPVPPPAVGGLPKERPVSPSMGARFWDAESRQDFVWDGFRWGAMRYATLVGDGVSTRIRVEHDLGTYDVRVDVYEVAQPRASVLVAVERPTVNAVELVFASAPKADELKVMVSR